MRCLYREIDDRFKHIALRLEEEHLTYAAYERGLQYNVEDTNGIIHTFWPSKGTIMFHRGNSKKERDYAVLRRRSLNEFIRYLRNPDAIQQIIDEQTKSKDREGHISLAWVKNKNKTKGEVNGRKRTESSVNN